MRIHSIIRATSLYRAARGVYRSIKPMSGREKDDRYDEETAEVMRRTLRPGTIGVDVGAHSGVFLRQMFALAPDHRHVAVEPLPHMAARLRRDFPDAHVVEAALSDRPGTATFYHLVNAAAESGLRRIDAHGDASMVEELSVRVMRLDDVIGPSDAVAFVKIDTEGAELPVIRGAAATIRRCRPVIVFETGSRSTPHYGIGPDDIFAAIAELGIQLSTMRRWLDGHGPLTPEAFRRAFCQTTDFYFIAY